MSRTIRAMLSVAFIWALSLTQAFASPQGRVEFSDLSSSYGMPTVEINLSKALLGMVASFAQSENPELKNILSKIDEVSVRVYDVGDKPASAFTAVETMTKSLRAAQWQPFVSVNESGQKVRIFGKTTKDVMDGLVVMVVGAEDHEREAVFINIVGEIDPNEVSSVTGALNVDFGNGAKK